jgi:hypothetical protein
MPMTREQILQEQASARVYQERYDNALQPWGARADAKPLSQDIYDYRRDHTARIQQFLPEGHELRSIPIHKLAADAYEVYEKQILDAAADSAWRPDAVPKGTIERRTKTDDFGLKIISYLGEESFVREMGRPGRRVASFCGPHGYITASGRPLR